MKYMFSLLITGAVLLSACAPITPIARHGGTSGGHQQGNLQEAKNLIVRDQSTDSDIVFSVRDGDEVFMEYGISHTKEMHLIVVRDDLRHFQHVHPERDSAGVWRVAFTPPAGGTYWHYADFVGTDERPYTIRFDRAYAGNSGAYGTVKNFETAKTFDGYQISFQPVVSGNEVTFTHDITDRQGQSVQLEKYLGAKGHSVLISPSGDFIHTHASDEGDKPVFATIKPSDGFYRVFTQFQINGKVVTVDFDWSLDMPR